MLYDWIKNMDFAYPFVFGLFVMLPFLIWWYIKKYDKGQSTLIVSTVHAFPVASWKSRLRHSLFIFRILALSSLIFALARPQKRNEQSQTEGEGIDIVLCMDVSGSMGSRDITPSRMEVAKEVAIEFIQNRPVDRIGLVIFSGESFTQCPITTDRNTLISQVQSLESRKYLVDGTVIGEGLATAVDRLSKSEGKSKVIILLTDGKEDPPATRLIDPLTALEIAKSKKVKIYTIGMSAQPSTVIENRGKVKKVKSPDADFLDEELLTKMAFETGGKYFRAKDKDGLVNIYNQINTLEKSKVDIRIFNKREEKYYPFLLAALAFSLSEFVLRYLFLRKFP